MKFWIYALVVLALAGAAGSAHGSWESSVQVAQPILVESGETSVRICRVPYVGYGLHPRDSGKAIGLTVAPNLLWCDGRAQNRNLAAVAGIGFVVETVPDRFGEGVVTALRDTLHVTVKLGVADPDRTLNSSIATILAATLWCGLLNARQVWPEVKFVEYLVEDTTLSRHSGVYSLDGLESSADAGWGQDLTNALEACRRPSERKK